MNTLTLERYAYTETETEGRMRLDDGTTLYTLERPWRAGVPGGVPFQSCVPDGRYELLQHRRENGNVVLALRNPDCHVWYTDQERAGQPGRYLILIHSGNYVEDVVGCIAPGLDRVIHNNRRMVTNSRKAMGRLMAGNYSTLVIKPHCGTECT